MGEKYIQLRGLNESIYCEKLFYMMYVQGIFQENEDTIEGTYHHKKREETKHNNLLDGIDLFSITLYAMDGILSAKLDGVMKEGDEYIPIEDKNSKMPEKEYECTLWGVKIKTQIWVNDFPQIVGQMYLLRKNHYKCSKGKVYYRGSNKMVEIAYEDRFDQLIENGVQYCLKLMSNPMPKPLVDSDKCIRCSLNWACLPDETNLISKEVTETRRLYPGRPDSSILYVTTVGSKIGKEGESISVWNPQGEKKLIPRKDVEHICVFGNIQVTTQAMQEIIKEGGSIFYFTSSGWLQAVTMTPISKNIYLRIAQFDKFRDNKFTCELVKKLVQSKIENQRTLLRRNRKENIDDILTSLKIHKNKVLESDNIDSIRGYEGNAAKEYWGAYETLIKNREKWKMDGRNRRPPKDEINAMLSYGYSLLLRDFVSAIAECGMDYLYGFYHSIVPGRPALALDLMEPYRPIIVDSVVLRMLNEEMVQKEDFAKVNEGIYMTPQVKKKLIYMYEKRMDEMITHPQFGYSLSYRRMIHLETKLLGKYILGEVEEYKPLTTR